MKTKFAISALLSLSLTSSLAAAGAGQIFVPKNKMVNAWQKGELGEPEGAEFLPMDPERAEKFDFEKAARWSPLQVEFALKSYTYVMKNGFAENQGPFSKALGMLALTIGYEYDVEPSYNQGLYTRSDRYFLSPGFEMKHTFKNLSGGNKIRGALGPSYNIEFGFQRQFSDPKLAILAAPYFDQQVPFNAERTLNGLKEGDLFSFRAHLDILTDISYLSSLGLGSVLVSAGPYFILRGGFEVHILRLPDNKARIKVVGIRRQGGGVKGGIGFDGLKILGAQFIDDKIVEKGLDANLITAKYQRNLNRLFAADYIVDLKNPKAAEAYDTALAQARSFEYMKIVNPMRKHGEIKDKVLSNMTVLENLARKDENLVKRIFSGDNKSTNSEFQIELGNRLMGLGGGSRSSKNDITTIDRDGNSVVYEFQTKEKNSDFKFFYSLFETRNQSRASSVSQNVEGELVPLSFVISSERTDRRFTRREFESVQESLKAALGPQIHNVDFSAWRQKDKLSNVVVRTQVILTAKALNALPEMTADQIQTAYLQYLSGLSVAAQGLTARVSGTAAPTIEERQEESVRGVRSRLEDVLSKKVSLQKKMQVLSKLRGNLLFRSTGSGFLLSLLRPEQVKDLVRIDLSMSSTDGQKLELSQGPEGPKQLYNQLLYTENLTNDSELELRLEAETLR